MKNIKKEKLSKEKPQPEVDRSFWPWHQRLAECWAAMLCSGAAATKHGSFYLKEIAKYWKIEKLTKK